jgi:lysophospholipid acyltransferase
MIPEDQIKILSSMLICIPLSYLLPKIPRALYRELYSTILGTLVQLFIYGKDLGIIFVLHALVYGLLKWRRRNCGNVVTIVSLVLLSVYHIYRMVVDYGGWAMDISTIMMCNVNKYSFFAYAYQDGKTEESKLTK